MSCQPDPIWFSKSFHFCLFEPAYCFVFSCPGSSIGPLRVYNLQEPVYNLQEPVYNLQELVYNLQEPVFNLQELVYNLQEPVYNLQEPVPL